MKRSCWQFHVAARSTVEQGVKAVTNSLAVGDGSREEVEEEVG